METDALRQFYKSRIRKLRAQGRDELATIFRTEARMNHLEKRISQALAKAIGKIGGEYLPSKEWSENPNSMPGAFPESGGDPLLDHINRTTKIVEPQMTKRVHDQALAALGVRPRPRVTEPKPRRVATLADTNFRR